MHQLPGTDLHVSNVILGMLRITSLDAEGIRELVSAARESGINMFDNSDIYGDSRHDCESRFGAAVTFTPSEREEVIIQSKTGIMDGYYDSSREHIIQSVHGSLRALQTEYLDVLLLHRPDTLVEPDEVAAAFESLHAEGLVRHFGVSNHTPGQIELLKRSVTRPLVINQVQLSITHAPLIAQGMAANIEGFDQALDHDNGLLDYSRNTGMTLQAWSPFQTNEDEGVFLGDTENFGELNEQIDSLADRYSVEPTALPVAWITRHPARMQVVIGTTKPHRVRAAAAGSDLSLTRQEWYSLFSAAGYDVP